METNTTHRARLRYETDILFGKAPREEILREASEDPDLTPADIAGLAETPEPVVFTLSDPIAKTVASVTAQTFETLTDGLFALLTGEAHDLEYRTGSSSITTAWRIRRWGSHASDIFQLKFVCGFQEGSGIYEHLEEIEVILRKWFGAKSASGVFQTVPSEVA